MTGVDKLIPLRSPLSNVKIVTIWDQINVHLEVIMQIKIKCGLCEFVATDLTYLKMHLLKCENFICDDCNFN